MSTLTTHGCGESFITTLVPDKIAESIDSHFEGRGWAQDVNGDVIESNYPASGGTTVTVTTARRQIEGPNGPIVENDASMKLRHENTVKGKAGQIPPWCP